ncbi:hypothetical protein QQX98_011524 [Neonectria punicea]|uniref:Uncharacterized protein n=1 Tax=Neonectria punicea TaxID=979145 RepID=A0ABR1GLQ0_9HYPO
MFSVEPFLNQFKLVVEEQQGPMPIRDQHHRVRDMCKEKNITLGMISRVLRVLEQNIKGAKDPRSGDGPYAITSADLEAVTTALDELHNPATRVPFMPTELQYALATTPSLWGEPPSSEQLAVSQDLALRDQLRWTRRQERMLAAGDESEVADTGFEDAMDPDSDEFMDPGNDDEPVTREDIIEISSDSPSEASLTWWEIVWGAGVLHLQAFKESVLRGV